MISNSDLLPLRSTYLNAISGSSSMRNGFANTPRISAVSRSIVAQDSTPHDALSISGRPIDPNRSIVAQDSTPHDAPYMSGRTINPDRSIVAQASASHDSPYMSGCPINPDRSIVAQASASHDLPYMSGQSINPDRSIVAQASASHSSNIASNSIPVAQASNTTHEASGLASSPVDTHLTGRLTRDGIVKLINDKITRVINNADKSGWYYKAKGLREIDRSKYPIYIDADTILNSFYKISNHHDMNSQAVYYKQARKNFSELVNRYIEIRAADAKAGNKGIDKGDLIDTSPDIHPYVKNHGEWMSKAAGDLTIVFLASLINKQSADITAEAIPPYAHGPMGLGANRASNWGHYGGAFRRAHPGDEFKPLEKILIEKSTFFPSHDMLSEIRNDSLTCFSCATTISGWKHDDDPDFKHAQYYPECHVLKLQYGSKALKEVHFWFNNGSKGPKPSLKAKVGESQGNTFAIKSSKNCGYCKEPMQNYISSSFHGGCNHTRYICMDHPPEECGVVCNNIVCDNPVDGNDNWQLVVIP